MVQALSGVKLCSSLDVASKSHIGGANYSCALHIYNINRDLLRYPGGEHTIWGPLQMAYFLKFSEINPEFDIICPVKLLSVMFGVGDFVHP